MRQVKLVNEEIEKNNKENKSKNEDKEKELNTDIRYKKLFLVAHPFISLFEDDINIKEIKNEIKNEYLNKKKDNI